MGEEIAVVGGSAAGLFAARELADAGRSVRVFDRNGSRGCTERLLIVTSRYLQVLNGLGSSSVVNHVDTFELFADGKMASFKLKDPDLIIERASLLTELEGAARSAGAGISHGRRFQTLVGDGDGLSLTFRRPSGGDEVVRANIAIGADGSSSSVARAAGWPRQPVVPLLQAKVRMPSEYDPHTTKVWFRPEDTSYFYWLIPESRTQAAVGLIADDTDRARVRRRLESFLKERELEPLSFQGGVIPEYSRWSPVRKQVGRGTIYLVGDAAGHVKVSTIGGVVTGLVGASGVVSAILDGGSARHLRSLRRELGLHLWVRRAISHFTEPDYRFLIERIDGQAERAFSESSRDRAAHILWSFCRTDPVLFLRALRCLLLKAPLAKRV